MEWVPVGKITKTHGLKGELKFHSFFEEDLLENFEHLKLIGGGGEESEISLESLRGSPTSLIIKLREIDSVDEARALAGQMVYAPVNEFRELPEGEYYSFQIEGLKAYDLDGNCYGEVVDIIKTGSNDVYVVSDGQKELLLPMIDWVIKTIDLEKGTLVFDNVEGLIEDSPV